SQLGSAGNFQWGLDAGNHQDGWDPYAGLPSHWNHEDCNEGDLDCDENELEVLCLQPFATVLVNNNHSARASKTASRNGGPAEVNPSSGHLQSRRHGGGHRCPPS
ncbi:hypothetical protein EDB19DRAFT_1642847, partial [Suillus lakei]